MQAQIDRTLRGKDNRILGMIREPECVLLWSGGADDPGTYYYFDRAARRMNIFASPYDSSTGALLAGQPFRYATRDGLSIPAYLTLPQGREAKDLPLIVLPHGGPFVRDSHAFNPWVQFLADRGYAVLQPNYRGSTGYGRAFVERGYGEWGRKMQDDLDDGVAWLAGQGIIDPKRVCIAGASYGGYAALWGAIRNPEIYRCAISMAGVTDVGSMLKYDSKFLIAKRYSKQWRKKVVGEQSRDLAASPPLQQAGRLNVPVLIAHGERAPTFRSTGPKLVAALKARGASSSRPSTRPKVKQLPPGRGFDRLPRRVEAFLEIHNPAATAAPCRGRRAPGSSPSRSAMTTCRRPSARKTSTSREIRFLSPPTAG